MLIEIKYNSPQTQRSEGRYIKKAHIINLRRTQQAITFKLQEQDNADYKPTT